MFISSKHLAPVSVRIPKELSEIYDFEKGDEVKLVPNGLEKLEIRKECEHHVK